MGPQNYTLGNVIDPGLAFSGGLQMGEQRLMQQQQRAMAMQQQQAAMAAQQERAAAVQAVLSDPSPRNYARLVAADPKNHEAYKSLWSPMDAQQKQARVSDLLQWNRAIESGRPDVAVKVMRERADLIERDAGGATSESQALRAQADSVEADPMMVARLYFRPMLEAEPSAKEAIANMTALAQEDRTAAEAPSKLRKVNADATGAEADAITKGVAAKYADQQAAADLKLKGVNVEVLLGDLELKKQANRIAAMNAATARANSDLQRQELSLKLDEARGKLAEKMREKVATAEAGANSIDNMLNTIERIKKNPSLNDVVGSIEGRLPVVFSDEAADATALIETLGSQAFLAQIPNIKGMGALSNAEGEKLQAALQNLGRVQSEKQFRASLDEAGRLLKKGREALSKSTGVPLSKPDTPAAPGARPPLDSFFK